MTSKFVWPMASLAMRLRAGPEFLYFENWLIFYLEGEPLMLSPAEFRELLKAKN